MSSKTCAISNLGLLDFKFQIIVLNAKIDECKNFLLFVDLVSSCTSRILSSVDAQTYAATCTSSAGFEKMMIT